MDIFLLELIACINGRFEYFDSVVAFGTESWLVKGTPPILIFWYLWFRRSVRQMENREMLFGLIGVAFFTALITRLLAKFLPFRQRPIHSDLLSSDIMENLRVDILIGESSFPSDHAALYFAVAVSLWMIDRWWGRLALLHAALIICLPRIYAGYHWPTDIFFGAAIGTAMAYFLLPRFAALVRKIRLLDSSQVPQWAIYPVVAFLTHQIATLFNAMRSFASTVIALVQ